MTDPARLVFPGFTVGVQNPRLAEDWVRLGVGGFCLYKGTPRTLRALTERLRRVAGRPLLFCADYEAGAAAHAAGSTALPSNLGVGASGSAAAAREKGLLTGREARAMGVDWVLAPVLDLAHEPANPIVNLRAFSDRPAEAARLGRAFLSGLRAAGALGCLKHFPGHGDTRKDSHLDLPVVRASRALLNRRELAPFKALARGADAVMAGHLVAPALDAARLPMTLSAAGPRLLRSWGFRGLVVTDALDMKAIADRWGEAEAALMALRGGADILLVPRDPRALIAELRVACADDAALTRRAADAGRRLDAALRKAAGVRPPLSTVASPAHGRAAAALFASCAAWKRPSVDPAPKAVAYFEPQAGARAPIEGGAFASSLRQAGVRARVDRSGRARKGERLVIGYFAGPRAYSGRIRLDGRARAAAVVAARRAGTATAVSFGSPFVFGGLPGRVAKLGVFSAAPGAQRAAAAAVAGTLRAKGRWPVSI